MLIHGILEMTLLKDEKAKPKRRQMEVHPPMAGSRELVTTRRMVLPVDRGTAQ